MATTRVRILKQYRAPRPMGIVLRRLSITPRVTVVGVSLLLAVGIVVAAPLQSADDRARAAVLGVVASRQPSPSVVVVTASPEDLRAGGCAEALADVVARGAARGALLVPPTGVFCAGSGSSEIGAPQDSPSVAGSAAPQASLGALLAKPSADRKPATEKRAPPGAKASAAVKPATEKRAPSGVKTKAATKAAADKRASSGKTSASGSPLAAGAPSGKTSAAPDSPVASAPTARPSADSPGIVALPAELLIRGDDGAVAGFAAPPEDASRLRSLGIAEVRWVVAPPVESVPRVALADLRTGRVDPADVARARIVVVGMEDPSAPRPVAADVARTLGGLLDGGRRELAPSWLAAVLVALGGALVGAAHRRRGLPAAAAAFVASAALLGVIQIGLAWLTTRSLMPLASAGAALGVSFGGVLAAHLMAWRSAMVRAGELLERAALFRSQGLHLIPDAEFWPRVARLAAQVHPADLVLVAELPPGGWHLRFWQGYANVAEPTPAHGGDDGGDTHLGETAVKERRRDVRRSPYSSEQGVPMLRVVPNFLVTPNVPTVVVPLIAFGEIEGYVFLCGPRAEAAFAQDSTPAERLAQELALLLRRRRVAAIQESGWRHVAGALEDSTPRQAATLVDRANVALNDLRLFGALLRDAPVSLLYADSFGDVRIASRSFARLMEPYGITLPTEEIPPGTISLSDILVALGSTGDSITPSSRRVGPASQSQRAGSRSASSRSPASSPAYDGGVPHSNKPGSASKRTPGGELSVSAIADVMGSDEGISVKLTAQAMGALSELFAGAALGSRPSIPGGSSPPRPSLPGGPGPVSGRAGSSPSRPSPSSGPGQVSGRTGSYPSRPPLSVGGHRGMAAAGVGSLVLSVRAIRQNADGASWIAGYAVSLVSQEPDNMRTLAGIGGGDPLVPFSLREAVAQAAASVAGATGSQLRIEAPRSTPQVLGHRIELSRALEGFLLDAVSASPRTAPVISLRERRRVVELMVLDLDLGVPQSALERVLLAPSAAPPGLEPLGRLVTAVENAHGSVAIQGDGGWGASLVIELLRARDRIVARERLGDLHELVEVRPEPLAGNAPRPDPAVEVPLRIVRD